MVAILKENEIMVYQVCNAYDLFARTQEGWEMVETFDISVPVTWSETAQDTSQHASYQSTVSLMKGSVGTERKFLLKRPADSPIPKLQERIGNLEHQVHVQENLHSTALKDKQRELDVHYTEQLRNAEKQHAQDLGALRTTNRKLEGDIAKIRQEVGEARMREILAPAEAKS